MQTANRLAASPTLCALVLIAAGCTQGNAGSKGAGSNEAAVRRLVAAQATSEFGLWTKSSEVVVRPEDVALEPGPDVGQSIRVVRAIPPRDHWHPYLVAVRDTQVYGLGGFSAPEIAAVSEWLSELPHTENARALARTLALLADDDGAMRSFFVSAPSDSSQAAVAAAWRRVMPLNWPTDTVLNASALGRSVRITLLSQQTRSYDLGWRATAFDFQFAGRGRLTSWSKRVGDKFRTASP